MLNTLIDFVVYAQLLAFLLISGNNLTKLTKTTSCEAVIYAFHVLFLHTVESH